VEKYISSYVEELLVLVKHSESWLNELVVTIYDFL